MTKTNFIFSTRSNSQKFCAVIIGVIAVLFSIYFLGYAVGILLK